MEQKTRSENSIKNASVALIYYIITNIFAFVMRMVLTRFIGIEYAGLNSLLINILGVLNIAELGLGVAVGYSLYKPLAEKDYEKINEILCLFKYLYKIIAIIIAIAGIFITIFIDSFVTSDIPLEEIRISFILYLIVTIASYLLTFLNVLPSADQRNYMVVKIQNNGKILKDILQILSIVILKNFYVWLLIEIISSIIIYFYTNIKIKKDYKWYKEDNTKSLKELLKKYKAIVKSTKDLIFHKIGGLIVYQTDIILISYFGTLTDSGIYSNYMLIYTMLTGVIEQAFNGITASIGNLIVEKSDKETFNIWKEIYVIMMFITILFGFLFYQLANPFISVCFGEEYILSSIIVLGIVINTMFRIIKNPIDKFKDAYGIFWDRYAPIIEAIINLVFSIWFGIKLGILGVVAGTIVSNIVITLCWKPYVIFKYGFKEKVSKFFIITFKYLIIGGIGILIAYLIINKIKINIVNSILNLIVLFAINGIVALIIIAGCYMCDKYFRETFKKYLFLVLKNK